MRKILILITLARFLATTAFAAEDFTEDYQVFYEVEENGLARVTQDIALTNNTPDRYVSDYTITLRSEKISQVRARDRLGELTPQINQKEGATEITVVFKDKVVGAKRRLEWAIEYFAEEIAVKRGAMWEIMIPRLPESPEIKSYNLSLSLPQSFGPEMFVIPPPQEKSVQSGRYRYLFSKEDFAKSGVRLAFGEKQQFSLELTYHLRNPHFVSSLTEIALPPDRLGEQQVIWENLTPPPLAVRLDNDGNYLAQYKLPARQSQEVNWRGKILLKSPSADLNFAGQIEETPAGLKNLYTRPDKFWESENPQIKALAASLLDKNRSAAENAQRLYDFVVNNLRYDWESSPSGARPRLGAREALAKKEKAVCTEYTDLLIALTRAVGIPARRLAGYAYPAQGAQQPLPRESLHTWVEIYLPKIGWRASDPTWGSTTQGLDYFSQLDTNHIVFAINGEDSEIPYPAGTYKLDSSQGGDLKILFFGEENYEPPPVNLKFSGQGEKLLIENTGAVAALDLMVEKTFLGTLPPYGHRTINFPSQSPPPEKISFFYKNMAGALLEGTQEITPARAFPSPARSLLPAAILLAALLLCGFLFFQLNPWGFRQKLPLLRPHPLRAQDQSPNRRS